MSKKKFLLLSLDDEKTKKIANIVNNDSSKKILEYLSEKSATESQIAKELKLPISTVHYNIQQLLDAKLVDWKDYHYSEKGKEVRHYTLANKYIIIAPKEEKEGLLDIIKKIIPTFSIAIIGAFLIEIYKRFTQINYNGMVLSESSEIMPMRATEDYSYDTVSSQTQTYLISEPTIFFLIGSTIAIVSIILYLYIKRK